MMIVGAFFVTYTLIDQSLNEHVELINPSLNNDIKLDNISSESTALLARHLSLRELIIEDVSKTTQWQSNTSLSKPILVLFPALASQYAGFTKDVSYRYKIDFSPIHYQLLLLLSYFTAAATAVYVICLFNVKRLLIKVERRLHNEIIDAHTPHRPTFPSVSKLFVKQKLEASKELQEQQDKVESLSKQINLDNLTGLYNRFYFRGELSKLLSDKINKQTAIVALIRATALDHINKQRGYQFGDQYLKDLSSLLQQCTRRYPDCQLYRISGPDFALVTPKMTTAVAHKLAREIKANLDEYQANNDLENVAYIGITDAESGQQPEQVLSRADAALAKAQVEGVNFWAFQQQDATESESANQGETYWKSTIEDVLKKRSMMLLSQPVQAIHRNMKNYQEIYIRFIGNNNAMLPTDTFFAMAQRLDYTVKTDQMIIENIISVGRSQMDENCYWGVNLASHSVQSSAFIVWLERLLLREPTIAANLVFEIDESVLEKNIVSSKRAIDMLRRVGCRSAISKFGHGISSFKLFKELKPNYIKMDSDLIQNISGDTASQQFLRMIVDVAHRMGCQVIAEGVEDHSQKQLLESMYVDGIQGYLIARPAPMKKLAS